MFKFSFIDRKNRVEEKDISGEENDGKWKVVGCRVTEDELRQHSQRLAWALTHMMTRRRAKRTTTTAWLRNWFMRAATSSSYMTWAGGSLPVSKCQREGVSYGCIGCSQTDDGPQYLIEDWNQDIIDRYDGKRRKHSPSISIS